MLGSQEAVRMYIPSYLYYLSGSKPRMHSFEAVWWNSCSRFKHCAVTSAAPAIPADSSNADTATNTLQQFVRIRSSLVHSSLVRRIILTDANHTSAGSERGQPIVLPIRPTIFDPDMPAFDKAGLLKRTRTGGESLPRTSVREAYQPASPAAAPARRAAIRLHCC